MSARLAISVIEAREVKGDTSAEPHYYVKLKLAGAEARTDIAKGADSPKFLKDIKFTVANPDTDRLRVDLLQVGPAGDLVIGSASLTIISVVGKGTVVHWLDLQNACKTTGAKLCVVLRLSSGLSRAPSPQSAALVDMIQQALPPVQEPQPQPLQQPQQLQEPQQPQRQSEQAQQAQQPQQTKQAQQHQPQLQQPQRPQLQPQPDRAASRVFKQPGAVARQEALRWPGDNTLGNGSKDGPLQPLELESSEDLIKAKHSAPRQRGPRAASTSDARRTDAAAALPPSASAIAAGLRKSKSGGRSHRHSRSSHATSGGIPRPFAIGCGMLVGALVYMWHKRPVYYQVRHGDTLCSVGACAKRRLLGGYGPSTEPAAPQDIILPGDRLRIR